MKKLTDLAIKAALTNPGTYQDGGGLFLKVDKRGGAYRPLRLQSDGKRRDIGLGSAKLLPLVEARQKANELRKAIKIDRRDVLAERKGEAAAKVTFREAARQYHSENAAGWKSAIYARQWLASLESHAFSKLGDVPTGGIAAADIIDVQLPIWQEIPETARQVRNRICVVLDYAHAKGWRSSEAPSSYGSLKTGRGWPRQVRSRKNRKAMRYDVLPAFIMTLRRKPAFGRGSTTLGLTLDVGNRRITGFGTDAGLIGGATPGASLVVGADGASGTAKSTSTTITAERVVGGSLTIGDDATYSAVAFRAGPEAKVSVGRDFTRSRTLIGSEVDRCP